MKSKRITFMLGILLLTLVSVALVPEAVSAFKLSNVRQQLGFLNQEKSKTEERYNLLTLYKKQLNELRNDLAKNWAYYPENYDLKNQLQNRLDQLFLSLSKDVFIYCDHQSYLTRDQMSELLRACNKNLLEAISTESSKRVKISSELLKLQAEEISISLK